MTRKRSGTVLSELGNGLPPLLNILNGFLLKLQVVTLPGLCHSGHLESGLWFHLALSNSLCLLEILTAQIWGLLRLFIELDHQIESLASYHILKPCESRLDMGAAMAREFVY